MPWADNAKGDVRSSGHRHESLGFGSPARGVQEVPGPKAAGTHPPCRFQSISRMLEDTDQRCLTERSQTTSRASHLRMRTVKTLRAYA